MKITLNRNARGATYTTGILSIDGQFECYTLEDQVRDDPNPATPQNEAKVMAETAIPTGTYNVIINLSPRFKRKMIRLLDVPGFTGILIHGGNTVKDSAGCILVGQQLKGATIVGGTSTPAIRALQAKVQAALDKGEKVSIQIINDWEGV